MDPRIVLPSAMAAVVLAGVLGFYLAQDASPQDAGGPADPGQAGSGFGPPVIAPPASFEGTQQLKKFSSEEELRDFLAGAAAYGGPRHYGFGQGFLANEIAMPAFQVSEGMLRSPGTAESVALDSVVATDYSSTNIQVAGVDEPDFLKTDGDYIYVVKDRSLTIIDAYPADGAEVVARVALDIGTQDLQSMFLNGDRLVVFYQGYGDRDVIPEFDFMPVRDTTPATHAVVIDVSDRGAPAILRDYSVDGYFADARMIGDYVYFVSTVWADYFVPTIPRVMDGASGEAVFWPDVFYFDSPAADYNFNTITALNVLDESFVNSQTYLMGASGTIYVSRDALYAAYQSSPRLYHDRVQEDRFFGVVVPLLPQQVQDDINSIASQDGGLKWAQISDVLQDAYNGMDGEDRKRLFDRIEGALAEYHAKVVADAHRTVIHKVLLDGGNLEYQAKGEVPGWLLNQFSMDEYGDRFRVATTNERVSQDGGFTEYNSVYVMDKDGLGVVGSVENLAEDESIFSARFMGDRLYLVTFERIDPFFVIDLSADQPEVLGELKIPGFSNYLHPYDGDHVIGVGRDTKEDSGRVVQLGVKLALFDVSDVRNPSVLDEVVIGDGSTGSAALYNHRAFLFDKARDVLSIPIEGGAPGAADPGGAAQRDAYWYGFYVYGLDTRDGFGLKGTIDHSESADSYLPSGPRSLYIEDVLYTVSADVIKMNDLDDIGNEINSVGLGPSGRIIDYLE